MQACNKLVTIHCKAGSVSVRFVFETRGKCQDFVARYKDDGIPYGINSPYCCTSIAITVRQSRSIEDREIGKQFAPLWKAFADQLKILFLDEDDEGVFILHVLDARSQILSIKDSRNGIVKPGFQTFAPLGSEQTFTIVVPDLSVPGISSEVLQRVLKPTGLMCDGRPLASSLFRRLAGRGAFFCCFLFRWILRLAAFLIRGSTLHRSSSYSWENGLGDCGLPCDPLSCFLFSALCLRCSQSFFFGAGDSVSEGC